MDVVDFRVTSAKIGPHAHPIAVEGELDLYSAPDVKEELASLSPGAHLLIDLSAISFIDSAGLGVLATAARRVRAAGGTVLLVVGDHNVLKVLRITGLDRYFELRTPDEEPIRELVGLSLLASLGEDSQTGA